MVLSVLVVAGLLVGCAVTGPRFTPDVQKSFRDHDMRRMETARLELYYPAHRKSEARQIATRLEGCLRELEDNHVRRSDWGLVPVFLPEVEFNNAYVLFGLGQEPHMVIPTSFTANIFGQFGFTPSTSAVGCHEMVHFVHLTQIHGFFRALNRFLGPSINPQSGFDLWFFEGLATYYESQLVEGVGRQGSPVWEAYFAAGIADTHLDGGRMSHLDRAVPYGGHYLVGSHFVAYLVEEYGEASLWTLIYRQGRATAYPFGVSRRFQAVYGRSLGTLIDDFEEKMRRRYPARSIPEDQMDLGRAGRIASLESGPEGAIAVYSTDVDEVAAIEVFDADGNRLLRRQIPDVLPGRTLVSARAIEAMRFSPDGGELYFLANHLDSAQARTTLMRLDLQKNRLHVAYDDLAAVGGDLTPDGDGYVAAVADGNRVRFTHLHLEEEKGPRELFVLPQGAYVGWVRICPEGTRLAATLMEDDQWSVALFSIEDGEMIGRWSTGLSHHPVFDPHWIDEKSLLFAASDGERVQVMEGRLESGEVVQHSDVPYMAYNPRLDGDGQIRFLNRQGWGWSHAKIGRSGSPTQAVHFAGDQEVEVRGYEELETPTPIVDDRRYSQLDGLFVPRLRVPFINISAGQGGEITDLAALLSMSGYDELGFHNWAVQGMWDFANEQASGSMAYVNAQLAPWYLSLEVAHLWTTTIPAVDAETVIGEPTAQRDRYASLRAIRQFYGMPLWAEFLAAEYLREATEDVGEQRSRLVGPEIGGQYRAGRASLYGGAQSLFGISGQIAGYPTVLGSDFDFAHLRTQVELHSPLPLSKRHRLRLSGRLRALPGVPDDADLMRVGGFSPFTPLATSGGQPSGPLVQELVPPGFLFAEILRGYEDFGLRANQVAIGDVDYRYPLIIDRGAASLFGYLPSFFIRELNLELFASAATLFDGQFHAAVGASADLSMVFWLIPLRFRYQVAQRLVDDEQLVHTLGLGVGF